MLYVYEFVPLLHHEQDALKNTLSKIGLNLVFLLHNLLPNQG